MCHASNGTCGGKGVPCNDTFGSGWLSNGLCCNDRPCCKFLKAPCVPETCPKGFKLLSNQTSSANCYYSSPADPATWNTWNTAEDHCASTDGAYLWRPNTEQEAIAIKNEVNYPSPMRLWTGANDIDNDGIFTFALENGSLSFNDLPFGIVGAPRNESCVMIINVVALWGWTKEPCTNVYPYICEYKLRVCP
ncbi:Hypothetical predicted protein [Mytilus galloprovincialis]|nr:Hypothetical predicted protein [Mytilus galloprovincialis]